MFEFILINREFFFFVLVLSLFLFWKRKHLDVQGSFPLFYVMLYRTKLGLGKMKTWSKKYPKLFLGLAHFCIFVGVVGMIGMFSLMFWQLDFIIDQGLSSGGGLVLPLQTEKGLDSSVPVFYVPFWYWIIALFILVVVHEFAHGVIAERFNIRIKSSGLAFFGILLPFIPGAFVEPDEKDLQKKKKWQQIAVYGAGSASNFVFGIIFLLLWIGSGFVIDKTMDYGEISFVAVDNTSSLSNYGLQSGTILAFNNKTESSEILQGLRNLSTNQTIALTIESEGEIRDYEVTTIADSLYPQVGRVGITLDSQNLLVTKDEYSYVGDIPLKAERLFYWIWLLNIMIGLFNLLPIWITDGGQIARAMFEKVFKKNTALRLYNWVSIVSLVLIIFTIWPSLLISLISLF